MRWRDEGNDGGLSTPKNTVETTFITSVINAWDKNEVQPITKGHTEFGCGCGAGGTKKAKKNDCCDFRSLRIDAQRRFSVGKGKVLVPFNSYNIQYGSNSYAAVNIQCNVTVTVAEIRTGFQNSMTNRCRVWVGNQAGRTAYTNEGRTGLDD